MLSPARKRLLIMVAATLIVVAGFYLFLKTKEKPSLSPAGKTTEDVLKSLTAPAGSVAEVPKDVLDSLTAPKKKSSPVPEDVLKSLTAPK